MSVRAVQKVNARGLMSSTLADNVTEVSTLQFLNTSSPNVFTLPGILILVIPLLAKAPAPRFQIWVHLDISTFSRPVHPLKALPLISFTPLGTTKFLRCSRFWKALLSITRRAQVPRKLNSSSAVTVDNAPSPMTSSWDPSGTFIILSPVQNWNAAPNLVSEVGSVTFSSFFELENMLVPKVDICEGSSNETSLSSTMSLKALAPKDLIVFGIWSFVM